MFRLEILNPDRKSKIIRVQVIIKKKIFNFIRNSNFLFIIFSVNSRRKTRKKYTEQPLPSDEPVEFQAGSSDEYEPQSESESSSDDGK